MPSTQEAPAPASYIDFAPLTTPAFAPHAYANALVRSTCHPADAPPVDLATPLSRALFDLQEIDTRIDALATAHAAALVEYTRVRREASVRVLAGVEEQVAALVGGYERLAVEVQGRWGEAERVRVAAQGVARVVRVGRGVARCLVLGKGVEGLMEGVARGGAMVPAAEALLGLRRVLAEEGEVGRVLVVQTLRAEVAGPAERVLVARAQGVVREFSMTAVAGGGGGGGQQTYAQTEDMKTRATSALQTLYLLSPLPTPHSKPAAAPPAPSSTADFEPTLLIAALSTYLQTALTSSLAALARALATLPTLDRTLLEISARCQNILALETLLACTKPPAHPLLTPSPPPTTTPTPTPPTLLTPLLKHLDTASLPSYFWRTLASHLSPRVNEILSRGGVSARTLRSNRDRVREMIRECVDRGSRVGGGGGGSGSGGQGTWEREAAVMVGSVVGPLGGRG
ncbi:hypothetical protein LTR08_000992 [Meristemomyces frigidus]|nr:hypothetical protein LTR08_000992 [Meristemomyces frigidus]